MLRWNIFVELVDDVLTYLGVVDAATQDAAVQLGAQYWEYPLHMIHAIEVNS
jgi:hypothetical protein